MEIKFLRDTLLKAQPIDSGDLSDRDKVQIKSGSAYPILAYAQTSNNHTRVTFDAEVFGSPPRNTWNVFNGHIDIEGDDKEFELKVPYFSQRDNLVDWHRTCNSSSSAMFAEYFKPGCIGNSDDLYWSKYVRERGDTTSHNVQTAALKALGINSEFRTDLGYDDLDRELDANCPVVISVLHKGTIATPTGGHVLIVIGKYPGGYICHDPWGKGFDYADHNGKSVRYPCSPSLDARWLEGRSNGGWGRIFKGFI